MYHPDETGLNYVYWEASAGVDAEMVVRNHENWTWKPEVEDNPDEYEDEAQSAIGDALYAANIYPDDGEADYSNPMNTVLELMVAILIGIRWLYLVG